MGVAHCIDYRNEDFLERVKDLTEGRGVDIVLDAVGADSFKKSYSCLAPLGRLFLFGSSSVAPLSGLSVPAFDTLSGAALSSA